MIEARARAGSSSHYRAAISSIPASALRDYDSLKAYAERLLRAGDVIEFDLLRSRVDSPGLTAWFYAKQWHE